MPLYISSRQALLAPPTGSGVPVNAILNVSAQPVLNASAQYVLNTG